MTLVDQTEFEGTGPGNSLSACLATLLDIPLTDVPALIVGADAATINIWLAPRGLCLIEYSSIPPDDYKMMGIVIHHIISGPSPRGLPWLHSVVGRNGKIVHDPHPSRAGLLHGRWAHTVIVKTCITY